MNRQKPEELRDFYRFSKYGLKYLFEKVGFEIVELNGTFKFLSDFRGSCLSIVPAAFDVGNVVCFGGLSSKSVFPYFLLVSSSGRKYAIFKGNEVTQEQGSEIPNLYILLRII